jgi:hypothetical protein
MRWEDRTGLGGQERYIQRFGKGKSKLGRNDGRWEDNLSSLNRMGGCM